MPRSGPRHRNQELKGARLRAHRSPRARIAYRQNIILNILSRSVLIETVKRNERLMTNDKRILEALASGTTRRQAVGGVAIALGGLVLGSTKAGAGADDGISHTSDSIHQERTFKASRKRVYDALNGRQTVRQGHTVEWSLAGHAKRRRREKQEDEGASFPGAGRPQIGSHERFSGGPRHRPRGEALRKLTCDVEPAALVMTVVRAEALHHANRIPAAPPAKPDACEIVCTPIHVVETSFATRTSRGGRGFSN